LQETDYGDREAEAAKVMPCFEDSTGLSAERAKCGESKQNWYEKRGPSQGAIEAGSPPGDKSAFISTAANHIGAHEGKENEQDSEELPAKTWCSSKFWERITCRLAKCGDAM
jgi:hypothetical protein